MSNWVIAVVGGIAVIIVMSIAWANNKILEMIARNKMEKSG